MTSQSSADDTASYRSTPSGTASHLSTPSGTASYRSTPSAVSEEPNEYNEGRGNSMLDRLDPGISGLTSSYTERQWQSMSYTRRVEEAREGLREACNTELLGGTKLINWIEEQRNAYQPTTTASGLVQQQRPSRSHSGLTKTQERNVRRSRKRAVSATLALEDVDYDS